MALISASPAVARRAALRDVNAIARLLSADRQQFAVEAQSELRLTLAHFGLETGQVWVVESETGGLEAAAVWIPPGASIDEGEYEALLRLHGLRPPAEMLTAPHSDGADPGEENWLLAAIGFAPTAGATAAEAVLAPVLSLADAAHLPVYADEPATHQAELLRGFGFLPWRAGGLLRRQPKHESWAESTVG